MFDDGEVIQGLDDRWSFGGANAVEWAVGVVVFVIIGSLARTPASAMPLMLFGWIGTTATLASIRKMFPDEERGVRNAALTAIGIRPQGIPAPARIQPVWSPCPLRRVHPSSKFSRLGLESIFPTLQAQLTEEEQNEKVYNG
ncbi:hypothetical protein JNK13_10390 [bacterium]|nr:hypothetical protein [bacterium]